MSFRPRSILVSAVLLLALGVVVLVVWTARHVLTWVLISLFLAVALNPAVEALRRRGLRRRGAAAAAIYLLALGAVAGVAALLLPTLVRQTADLIDAAPGYVSDITKGRGPLGFLETRYHLAERIHELLNGRGGVAGIAGGAHTALSVTMGIVTGVAGVVTIMFMTFFMLLEGPAWIERAYGLIAPEAQPRWRKVGHDIYRTVGGYVSGNLFISLIAGSATAVVLLLLGVPYALALGLVVALFDLLPLVGATIGAIIVTLVALTQSLTDAIIVAAFFVVYQQLENHFLQPIVYGRTVELSPLTVMISVLVGAELAGVFGALSAIPVAGTIQVLVRDCLEHRASRTNGGGDPRFEREPGAAAPRDGAAVAKGECA